MNPLDNLDILIPLYIDHDDRLSNLTNVIKILKTYNCNNIYVNEYFKDVPKATFIEGINYNNVKINDTSFNKMTCINEMAKKSKNKFLAIYDVDVIVNKNALIKSLEMLNVESDFVYPYNGHFYEIPKSSINEIITSGNITLSICSLIHPNSCGGCVIFKREVFELGGMCNPNFKNVGFDDDEIKARFLKLGYKMGKTENPIFHLEHARTSTSYGISVYDKHNQQEYYRICNMTNNQLLEEVSKWSNIN